MHQTLRSFFSYFGPQSDYEYLLLDDLTPKFIDESQGIPIDLKITTATTQVSDSLTFPNNSLSDNIIYDLLQKKYDISLVARSVISSSNIRNILHILRFITKDKIIINLNKIDLTLLYENGIDKGRTFLEILGGLNMNYNFYSTPDTDNLFCVLSCNLPRSPLRLACDRFIINASLVTCSELKSGDMLYVGTAGDPVGGEYSSLFHGFNIYTADADKRWNPDIVVDITKTSFDNNYWDVIIISNVIEHVPDLFVISKELQRILRPGGHLIIDCPWNYPYHAEPPSFGDYWRISLDGFIQLFGSGFEPILLEQNENSTHMLARKTFDS